MDKKWKNLTNECFKNERDSYAKQKRYINGSENLSLINMYFVEAIIFFENCRFSFHIIKGLLQNHQ